MGGAPLAENFYFGKTGGLQGLNLMGDRQRSVVMIKCAVTNTLCGLQPKQFLPEADFLAFGLRKIVGQKKKPPGISASKILVYRGIFSSSVK